MRTLASPDVLANHSYIHCRHLNRSLSKHALSQFSRKQGGVWKSLPPTSSSELVVQDYATEATVDRNFSAVVIDKPKLPELIHEKIDP